jgi:hypothetical protein
MGFIRTVDMCTYHWSICKLCGIFKLITMKINPIILYVLGITCIVILINIAFLVVYLRGEHVNLRPLVILDMFIPLFIWIGYQAYKERLY